MVVVPWEVTPGGFSSTNVVSGKSELGVLRLTTEEGVEGNAFVGSGSQDQPRLDASLARSIGYLQDILVGADAMRREHLWHRLAEMAGRRGARMHASLAMAADVALWDAAGKSLGAPIYQLLGGFREKVPAYASGPYYSDAESYTEEAATYQQKGFSAYKIHPGERPARQAAELCRRVRETVGPEMGLMLDWGSGPGDYHEALQMGRTLEELDFLWFEDPVPFWQLENLVELTRRLDVPIALHDYVQPLTNPLVNYITAGAGKILRSDTAKEGITGLRKLAALCEHHGLKLEPHHGANSLMNVADLHVILSVRNCDFYEHIVPEEWHQFGLVDEVKVDEDGYVHAPSAPGLGMEIDWPMIEGRQLAIVG